MIRTACALSLLLLLPSCVAAIGNTGYTTYDLPKTTTPILQEKVEAARRVLELRQRKLDDLRAHVEAGRADTASLFDAEISVEQARIQLLQFRAELEAVQSRKDDDQD